MNDLTESIAALKAKTEQIINLYKSLKEENESLNKKIDKVTQEIEEKNNKIRLLEEENKKIIITNNEEQQKIYTDSKQRINELVQEIDNCIALLK